MSLRIYSAILLFASLFTACENGLECFSDKREIISKTLPAEYYKNFHFTDVFDVKVFQDSARKITISGPESIVSKIYIDRQNSFSEIGIKDPCNFLKDQRQKVNINLYVPEIDTLEFFGQTHLEIPEAFESNRLVLHFWGKIGSCQVAAKTDKIFFHSISTTGKFVFSGKTRRFKGEIRKAAELDISRLDARFTVAIQHSVKDYKIRASERLIARIYNSGNLLIDSLPPIFEIHAYGNGRLIETEKH